jgi:uncharacterized protein YceH (UPF0502 family)
MEPLDTVEVRVLGALMEKEATTPEYYPLSLNALVNACNQKSNRHPVVDYDERTVGEALLSLQNKRLAAAAGGGRVEKYAQRISETLNLGRREAAVLCTLLLRGPQTLGEIKDRSERMFRFEGLEETEAALDRLAEWPGGGLAMKLPRLAGQKEPRYAHLLSGEPALEPGAALAEEETAAPGRIEQLEGDVQALRQEMSELKKRLEAMEARLG